MGKIQENDARLQQLVSMARIGWWEVDFDEGVYYCSEFVADLLGIEGNKISAKDFANLICENYRERILEEFRSFRMMEIYEQVFPIHSKYGMMWVSTKVGEKRITKEGHVRVMGMLQCISRQRMNMQEQTVDRLNSLLSRLNGISKSLLDFCILMILPWLSIRFKRRYCANFKQIVLIFLNWTGNCIRKSVPMK